MTLLRHLSVRQRRPAWLRAYPTPAFWEPWHLAVLSHGGIGNAPHPITFMAPVSHPATPSSHPAFQLLLTFEQRTALGHLAPQMRLERTVPESLLSGCLTAVVPDLHLYWGTLRLHVQTHLNPTEGPELDAAAQAIRQEVQSRGLAPDPAFFPAQVTDEDTYAALARAILYVGLLAHSPFSMFMYCARSAYVPYGALVLNVAVPAAFHGGSREVILGLHVAAAQAVQVGGKGATAYVPVLDSEVTFSTLYAPDSAQSSRMRTAGKSSAVILQ